MRNAKNNVLLIRVIEKCCPEDAKIKCHLQEKLRAKQYQEALRVANDGIQQGKACARSQYKTLNFLCQCLFFPCL